MGNCLPRKRNVSDVLSLTSASLSSTSLRSEEELKMLENLSMSDVEFTSVNTFVLEEDEPPGKVKTPVKFEVIDNLKVKQMPQRLASRMASRAASRMGKSRMEEYFSHMTRTRLADPTTLKQIKEVKGYIDRILQQQLTTGMTELDH